MLLLRNADGKEGPLFKGFACIVPEESTDCHGQTVRAPEYTTDAQWRRRRTRSARHCAASSTT